MGGRFSSGCVATYVFVLRPNPASSNVGTKYENYHFTKYGHNEYTKTLNVEEILELLHQCLRDIEVFMHNVRHILEQRDTLSKTKRKLKANKKKHHPSTSLCYSLPSELDVAETFKQFKLAINYIARLKHHLYEPNAPELIHRVFVHLATLVTLCQSFSIYNPNLPSRMVLPLLSRDAVRFLQLCLISKEMDLWRSLGKAWTLPRDEWRGGEEGSMYNAMFLEGWEACYPPNGTIVNSQPWIHNRNRYRSGGNTESETLTFFSEESRSFSTSRSRFS